MPPWTRFLQSPPSQRAASPQKIINLNSKALFMFMLRDPLKSDDVTKQILWIDVLFEKIKNFDSGWLSIRRATESCSEVSSPGALLLLLPWLRGVQLCGEGGSLQRDSVAGIFFWSWTWSSLGSRCEWRPEVVGRQGRSGVSLQENPVPSHRCSLHSLRVH